MKTMTDYRFNTLIVILICLSTSLTYAQNQNTDCGWLDTDLPVATRTELLVEALSTEEKIEQLMNATQGIPRLDIPEYDWWNESLHGVARNGKATVFPQAIGLAATFDENLMYRVASAISDEARAKFNVAVKNGNRRQYADLTFWSPNVNIYRDPRWGRGQETYGEDPYLSSRMGVAFVKGLQGDDPKYLKAAACAKHYVVHSGPEALRHEFDAVVSQKDLWETYMPAFKALVTEAGVEGVMGAYNRTNGESCSASPYLLTTVLKEEWDFDGYVVSDCGAVRDIYQNHKLCETPEEASALALKSGLHLNCGRTYESLSGALEQGLLTEEDIDATLIQLLKTRFRLGFFHPDDNNPYTKITPEVVESAEHVQLAREAAQKSLVMVKNNNVLPLMKDIQSIYITGPQANNADVLLGNYYGLSSNTVNILDGIISHVSVATTIRYKYGQLPFGKNINPLDWSTGLGRHYDATIAVFGISSLYEGEEGAAIASPTKGDNFSNRLPESQLDYIRKLSEKKGGKPLIVIISGGAPLSIPEIDEYADAIIYCWYPGEQGGNAVADVIFGDVSPSGRLPFTVPVSVEELPPYDDYSMAGRTYRYMDSNVLYPFGYGLSYANITYHDLKLKSARLGKNETLSLSAVVQNDSEIESEEVVQLYISQPGPEAPNYKLVSFRRVLLEAGEKEVVNFDIDASNLAQFNARGEEFVQEGKYKVFVGGTSPLEGERVKHGAGSIQMAEFWIE